MFHTRDLARCAVLAVAVLPAALFATACGDDDDEPGTTPTTTAAATPATPAERTPSAVPSASATTPARSPTATARRTGIDAILAAVEARDSAKLASLAATVEAGCTTAQGLGGPPKCTAGQAEGTVVRVFPVMSCEGGFVAPAQLAAVFNQAITGRDPQVFAVTTAKGASPEPYFPLGDYSVFLELKGSTAGGVMLSVNKDGKVVNMWTGCGGTAAQLYESRAGAQVLLPPLQRGG